MRGYGARARARAAGDVAPGALSPVPDLAASADFSTDRWGDAFWLVRPRAQGPTGPGELFVTSGSRIVRDARAELGITTGDVGWTTGLFEAARERVRAQLGGVPDLPAVTEGDVVPVQWLWLLLFATYSLSRGTGTLVTTPGSVVLPRLGARVGASDRPTLAALNFNPALLVRNPFGVRRTGAVVQGPGFSVAGARPKKRSGAALALVALAAMTIGGR